MRGKLAINQKTLASKKELKSSTFILRLVTKSP